MSGGAYHYAHRVVLEFAESLDAGCDADGEDRPTTPERLRFAAHLRLVAEAMRAIEWVDSGDGADEKNAIEKALRSAR